MGLAPLRLLVNMEVTESRGVGGRAVSRGVHFQSGSFGIGSGGSVSSSLRQWRVLVGNPKHSKLTRLP